MSMSLIWILSIFFMVPSSSNFECVRAESSVSTTQSPVTAVRCADVYNGEYPTMVFCGFRTLKVNSWIHTGSYMSSDGITCLALDGIGGSGTGIVAEARYIYLFYNHIPNHMVIHILLII